MSSDEAIDRRVNLWMTGYGIDVDALLQNEPGTLRETDQLAANAMKKEKENNIQENVQKNIPSTMRHLCVIFDCSDYINLQNKFKFPNFGHVVKALKTFANDFIKENPLSQLEFLTLKDKQAAKLLTINGEISSQSNAFKNLENYKPSGEASLQNGLILSLNILKNLPSYISREVLIIWCSLSTCDSAKLHNTMQILKDEKIRCSVISLTTEMKICHTLTKMTHGKFNYVFNHQHFCYQLKTYLQPQTATPSELKNQFEVGFVKYQSNKKEHHLPLTCMFHNDSPQNPISIEFTCPKCKSNFCTLPFKCNICGTILMTTSRLVDIYNKMFILPQFQKKECKNLAAKCHGCQTTITLSEDMYICESCELFFCKDCNDFMHNLLNRCIGCSLTPNEKTMNEIENEK